MRVNEVLYCFVLFKCLKHCLTQCFRVFQGQNPGCVFLQHILLSSGCKDVIHGRIIEITES